MGLVLWGLLGSPGATPSRGDVVYKKDGGKIQGTVDNVKSTPRHLVIKTRFGVVTIDRTTVADIEFADPDEKPIDFESAAEKFGPTAADQFKLAEWCLENGFRKEYRQQLEKVIQLDPDHAEARRRLGYREIDGKWMTREQSMESQGYVKYRGKYVLPQERDRAEELLQRKEAQQKYLYQFRRAQQLLRGNDAVKQEAARAEILAIRDTDAIEPLFGVFGEKGNENERALLVEVLAQIPHEQSTQGLLQVGLQDEIPSNRAAAAAVLLARKDPKLTASLVAQLGSNDNWRVRRSAELLGTLGDPSVVPALVQALITEHRHSRELGFNERLGQLRNQKYQPYVQEVLPDGTMVQRTLVGPNVAGQTSMSFGSGASDRLVTVERHMNTEVLQTLAAITGQNFGYDKDRWLVWLRDESAKKSSRVPGPAVSPGLVPGTPAATPAASNSPSP